MTNSDPDSGATPPRRRRPRYPGKFPRRFEHKYKELDPARHPDTVARVRESGKTPAGTHIPILVAEVIEHLRPEPGLRAVDATLGHGGHAAAILPRLLPGGHLLGLDADPVELPRAEARLRALGLGPDAFTTRHTNHAGLARALVQAGWADGADLILADLGLSSMQIDNPARGFTWKHDGPLDMRMNPARGEPASAWLARQDATSLAACLSEHADEPHALPIAQALAGRRIESTRALADHIRSALPRQRADELDRSIRRTFQAVRIAVNNEFATLDAFLAQLPGCLRPGGRVVILTFHSGEDRRVKHSFTEGLHAGAYAHIAREVVRPSDAERRNNPRSTPAKLRWAVRA
jgi:16S rRNA (cytosine1402-N4)-methyltransferase